MVRIHPHSDPSPRNRPSERHTSRNVSWSTSSASSALLVNRRASVYTPRSYARYRCSSASSSPARALATRLWASARGIVSAMTVTIEGCAGGVKGRAGESRGSAQHKHNYLNDLLTLDLVEYADRHAHGVIALVDVERRAGDA